jgi:hypothetical protein
MPSFEQQVQRKAEKHLMACWEAEDEPTEHDSPAFAPFCGCQTCIVREVLMVCWDEMMEEAKRAVAAKEADAPVQLHLLRNALRSVPRPGHNE